MFSDYMDPYEELVELHRKCDNMTRHYNELAHAHNMLSGEVEKQSKHISVLIESIKVLQQSQIYLLEDNDLHE